MPVKLDDDKIKYVIREKEKGTLNATIAESNSGVWHPGIHPVGQRILLCGRAKRHAKGNMDAYYL